MKTEISTALLSCTLGYAYALLFIMQFKKIHLTASSTLKIIIPLSRIACLAGSLIYLLRFSTNMVASLSFFVISWLITILIMQKKLFRS